ncbi:hypothetical protein NSK_008042 [Nannochloropsis salina CCMP1776]|uniref:PPM-type phosphatase domain-containing protein n=1 Tax=Nannochloropsis salina CCMP1776 TaxID=1027361 RepID=A0A4D9CPF6_9STRA|nr:hypothetical protein NSK_008042 [Nannochloropsis salina CCMP1776]|eukprot:TFJ80616.1 hypothetical protein NSK_008042 [Nannochloropsis salina CCMP1776]
MTPVLETQSCISTLSGQVPSKCRAQPEVESGVEGDRSTKSSTNGNGISRTIQESATPSLPRETSNSDGASSTLDSSTASSLATSATAAIQSIKGTIYPASGTFKGVSVAEEMNPLRRSTMEDVHRVLPVFDGDACMSFVGIYDGHGGRDIVDFLATELEKNVARELKVEDGASVPERLERAYLLTDVQSRQAELMGSGATAVTCLIKARREGEGEGAGETVREIYTANVGDSRAVLCHQGKGVRLTYDHKAEDKGEQARIEAAGGFVLRSRVLGILAVTRSFGDHRMKDYVIGVPYTSTTIVEDSTPEESPFLILACDGVWDVLSDDEAVGLVRGRWEREGRRPEVDAAGLLVQEAMRRGSSDNITCIVVLL